MDERLMFGGMTDEKHDVVMYLSKSIMVEEV